MPLHSDIHWIGRQWAVTGHGMQLIDQKPRGAFDIAISQLWEEAAIELLRAEPWLDVPDFNRGLEVARKRYVAAATISRATAPPRAFRMHFLGHARFVRAWRVQRRK